MELEINMAFCFSPNLCAAIISVVSIVLGIGFVYCFCWASKWRNAEKTVLLIPFQGRVPFHSQTTAFTKQPVTFLGAEANDHPQCLFSMMLLSYFRQSWVYLDPRHSLLTGNAETERFPIYSPSSKIPCRPFGFSLLFLLLCEITHFRIFRYMCYTHTHTYIYGTSEDVCVSVCVCLALVC